MSQKTPYSLLIEKVDSMMPKKYGAQLVIVSIATDYAGAVSKPLIDALQEIVGHPDRAVSIAIKALDDLSPMLAVK